MNGKVQRPGVCNALECLLVHRGAAGKLLPAVGRALADAGVELRCDPTSLTILQAGGGEGGPGEAGRLRQGVPRQDPRGARGARPRLARSTTSRASARSTPRRS